MKAFLGIDPGSSGALALLEDGQCPKFWDTPTVQVKSGKTFKRQLDPHAASLMLMAISQECLDPLLITIEKVAPMPNFRSKDDEGKPQQMGVTSAFSFGRDFGMWIGICAALQLPFQLVHPAAWKARVMAGMGKEKDASRVKAMQLFPLAAKDLNLKKHHNRADALLLAYYAMLVGIPQGKPIEQLGTTLFS
jgi:crossover junction endodeoxyribonuclease RuvC